MKIFLKNFSANLLSLACLGIAGYLVINGKDNWGWFLFIALITFGIYDEKD